MSATQQENNQVATDDTDRKTATSKKEAEDGGEAVEATAATKEPPAPQKQKKDSPFKSDYQPEVVYLYQFCRSGTIPSVSPFCLKVETWLRVAGVKYENVDHRLKLRSKKGKLPFVELNGNQIADSTIIIRELSKHFDRDLDANLSREQRVIGHALESMLEHHTAWVLAWWRYNNPGEFLVTSKTDMRQATKSKLPAGLVNFIVKMKFRSRRNAAMIQGIGVHTPEEIYEFGQKDLGHLEEFLGDKPYFFGDKPAVLDVVAFSLVTQFLLCQGEKFPLRKFLEDKCPNLVAHVERIEDRYWPDWKETCDSLDLNSHLPKPPPPPAVVEAAAVAPDNKEGDGEEKKDKEKDEEAVVVVQDEGDELKKDKKRKDNEKKAASGN